MFTSIEHKLFGMKKIVVLLSVFAFGIISFGQTFIYLDDDPLVNQSGQTLNFVVDHGAYKVYLHCINTTASTANYKFSRVILSQSTTFGDQFCDNNLCYPLSGTVDTTDSPQSVPAGDSTKMQPIFDFSDGGTASFRYYVLDLDNANSVLDSFDINVTSVMSSEEDKIELYSYPNPASDDFFLQFKGFESGDTYLIMHNLLGEEILRRTLVNGLNKINVNDLQNGVYFYSIATNNEIIETKKLIVRH